MNPFFLLQIYVLAAPLNILVCYPIPQYLTGRLLGHSRRLLQANMGRRGRRRGGALGPGYLGLGRQVWHDAKPGERRGSAFFFFFFFSLGFRYRVHLSFDLLADCF